MYPNALPARLLSIRDELDQTTARLHRLVEVVDEDTWGRRPSEGKWSIARCIEHLNITSHAYLPLFRAAFKNARARGITSKNPSYRLDLRGWLLLRSMEPPIRLRLKTPDAFVPPTIEPKEKVVREYDHLQGELIATLEDAFALDLGKIKIVSPFNAKLTYNAYSAFRLIPSHQRRHIAQAEKVLITLKSARKRARPASGS